MASNRNPGPVCQYLEPVVVVDGTMCRAASPLPGTVCVSRPQGIGDKVQRALNIKDAFLLGIRSYAYKETVAKLGTDLQLLIDSLWPGIVQVLEIIGISIGGGGLIGGALGAFAGGVGAIPGAALGAELGADVASLILLALGIKFLAEYCLQHLDQTNQHLQRGLKLAREACGEHPSLDPAAREFGRAIAELVSLILEAAAAWVLKKGLDAGLRDLNQSKLGRVLAPYAKVRYQIDKLRAPVPRRGITTTREFAQKQTRLSERSSVNEAKPASHQKATDFPRDATKEVVEQGKKPGGDHDPKSLHALPAAETTVLTKAQRLETVFQRVGSAPSAKTAEEAIQQMHGTLDAVEDAFSGVPRNPNPGLKPDGRMYPVQADRMVTDADGTITATSRAHVTTYGPNGSITVTDRATGAVVFQKPGGG